MSRPPRPARLAIMIAAALALLGNAAAAQEVTYDFDKSADFSQYRSYAWVTGTPLTDELNHKRVTGAIDAQLASKGLHRSAEGETPDVLVAYHAAFGRDLAVHGFSTGWAGYRFGPGRSGSARVEQILVGTLVVDIVDADTKTIVWRGIASKEIDVDAKPEKREKNINRAAEKLFRNYPPQQ